MRTAPAHPVLPLTGCDDPSTFRATYVSSQDERFTKRCGHGSVGHDLVSAVIDSWDLCMEACSAYNAYRRGATGPAAGPPCVGAVYVPAYIVEEWAHRRLGFPGNCFLKQALNVAPVEGTTEVVVSPLDS